MPLTLEDIRVRMVALQDEVETIGSTEGDFNQDQLERLEQVDIETAELSRQQDGLMRVQRVRGVSATDTPTPTRPTGDAPAQNRIDRLPHPLDGRGGFAHAGEFFQAIATASVPNIAQDSIDDRVARLAPTNVSTGGTAADGGYAIPPDFRQFIWEALMGEASLLGRTDQYATAFNTVTIPKDEGPVWAATGPQAYWVAEAAQKTDSKVALGQQSLKLEKLAALLPVTDELLSDSPMMNTYLGNKVPQVLSYAVDSAIISGDGSGKPTGIIGHAAAVSPTRTTGGTIVLADLANMWIRMPSQYRSTAIWLCNPDIEATLIQMAFDPAATSKVPIYLPGGNVAGPGFMTLMGRPVVPHEAMPALNAAGDITLWDPQGYMSVVKTGGQVQTDVSIHLYFDYDITTFRFVLRVNGLPWLAAPIARDNSNPNTFSSIVTLAAGL